MQAPEDDQTLMLAIARQDHAAFTKFLSRYLAPILVFIKRYVPNHAQAEDIAQDVFLRVWQHAARWQAEAGTPRSWCYRIAYNRCIDILRKNPLHDEDITELVSADTPESNAMARDRAKLLQDALHQLPERQRSALYLCTYQGLSNKEAANTLDTSIDALESLLARARRQLHKLITSAKGDDNGTKVINE